jgi:hypothetical protein
VDNRRQTVQVRRSSGPGENPSGIAPSEAPDGQKNAELQKALDAIKVLQAFIPICASCKKIRNDTGYWEQIESFLSNHTEARFSHGCCEECLKKLYPEIVGKNGDFI